MAAIPPNLEPAILEKAASGASTRDVSQWLFETHGVTASYKAVQRLLSRTKVERADVAKAVVREKLTATVLNDLDRLTREQRRVEKLASRLHTQACEALDKVAKADGRKDPEGLRAALLVADAFADLALKASDRVRTLADRKLHYSGADTPDDTLDELSQAEQRLAGRLDSLASRLGEGESAPGDSADPPGSGGP